MDALLTLLCFLLIINLFLAIATIGLLIFIIILLKGIIKYKNDGIINDSPQAGKRVRF